MSDVVRIADYERRSRNPDSCEPRNPIDADVIFIRRVDAPMIGPCMLIEVPERQTDKA